jgi:MoaA/NifB/PqqE/SkfB family radical SAM enzyme
MDANVSKELAKFVTSDYFIGAASLLLLMLLAKVFFRRCWISVSGSKFGKIRISRDALYAAIHEAASGVEGVSIRRVKAAIKRGKIYIDIFVRLGVGRSLSTVSEDGQVHLSNALVNDLGLGNIGKINVVVAGFSRKSCCSGEFFTENCCKSCDSKPGNGADEAG